MLASGARKYACTGNAPINVTPHPPPPLYGDRWGIGGNLTLRMCQIPDPSITIQCQIPTLYIHTCICAGTRANACAGQKPRPWGVISWRIPYQAPPYPLQGGWGVTVIGALAYCEKNIIAIIVQYCLSLWRCGALNLINAHRQRVSF